MKLINQGYFERYATNKHRVFINEKETPLTVVGNVKVVFKKTDPYTLIAVLELLISIGYEQINARHISNLINDYKSSVHSKHQNITESTSEFQNYASLKPFIASFK